ncbi:hypothetical protein [Bacillus paranthracis]|uniref:hypothetical protein n=1 Tax=Bacillus paranthracis TaxID=2026186 RepID=UPI001879755A|nr:hypothetical protein [Bacillus paranthracis]
MLVNIGGILLTGGFITGSMNDLQEGNKFGAIVGFICAAVMAVNVGVSIFG